jgi:hypothetical protein
MKAAWSLPVSSQLPGGIGFRPISKRAAAHR